MSALPSFSSFKEVIARGTFSDDAPLPTALKLWDGHAGKHTIFYAPLEHRNVAPKLALVGITPGKTQAVKALQAACTALRRGLSDEQCLVAAKLHASFGGDMRDKLVGMLDLMGIHRLVGESSTASLWTSHGYHKAHFCSLLSFPTFVGKKNYSGSPRIKESPAFRAMLEATAERLNALPEDAMVLPLGSNVTKALVALRREGLLRRELLTVDGKPICLPHPSGANAESIELVLNWQYDDPSEYAEARHAQYLQEKPWLKEPGGKQQSPSAYKSARISRWNAVSRLRQYFGVA